MRYIQPFARPANQDKKHYGLGRSTATPAKDYFTKEAGVTSEQEILDVIAGLTDLAAIEAALVKQFRSWTMAQEFIKRRLGGLK